MADLGSLTPFFKDLAEKSRCQRIAFLVLSKLLKEDGYGLYWDDTEERYCIYPLPKTLEEVLIQPGNTCPLCCISIPPNANGHLCKPSNPIPFEYGKEQNTE